MISAPDTKQGRRALELAIEQAFFLPGTAAHFATVFSTGAKKLHARDIWRIWDAARERGDLPALRRPPGGPKDRTTEKAPA